MTQQQPIQQMQQVEFVMAKTPEQIEAERKAAELLAFQNRIALLLAKEARVREENDDEAPEGLDHYTVKLDIDGAIWLFSHDSSTRMAIRGSGQPADRTVQISSRNVNIASEGAEEDFVYIEGYDGINVSDMFANGKKAEISGFVFSAMKRNDSDCERFLGFVMKHGDYKIEWPTNGKAVGLIDLYILIAKAKRESTPMRLEDGSIGLLESVEFVPAGMFNPDYIAFGVKRSLVIGGGVIPAKVVRETFETKSTEENIALRPASQEEVAQAVEIGRQNFLMLAGENPEEGHNHVMFNGTSYTPDWRGRPVPQNCKGRIVIDPEGLRLIDQHDLQGLYNMARIQVDLDRKRDEKTKAPTEQDLMLLEPVAVFFNLERCEWQLGYLKDISAIQFRENAFDRLVLDAQRKRLVESLVIHTNSGAARNVDIIDGKGGGAIFLLDGPPGTGKTLTAEATAEKLKRPLYKVGLGELGTNAERMEGKLNQVLNIARRWNAVLLLDEADVFLEKRSTENLARNAMVAVFLRLMEYYNGILFLTTNRGDNFDPAVMSRITLALHFKRPTEEGRRIIWTNLLENAEIQVTEQDLKNLAMLDINGREIKNAINSSQALAARDGTGVTYQHIRELTDAAARFTEEVIRETAPVENAETALVTRLASALLKLVGINK